MNFFWRKKKETVAKKGKLIIIYKLPDEKPTNFTYYTNSNRTAYESTTCRKFLKWYFGRKQSKSIFIIGSDNQREWRREHILYIEIK